MPPPLDHGILQVHVQVSKKDPENPNKCSVPMPTHHESSSIQHCTITATINHMINPVQKNHLVIMTTTI